jgi:hypothetical protein
MAAAAFPRPRAIAATPGAAAVDRILAVEAATSEEGVAVTSAAEVVTSVVGAVTPGVEAAIPEVAAATAVVVITVK